MHSALYPNLVAHSARLKDVAIGKLKNHTIRIDDYFDALEAWMELAGDEYCGPKAPPPPRGMEAARHALSLLQSLERNLDPATATSAVLRPTVSFYDVVLQAYAVSGGGETAAMEAQALLEHMLKNARATGQVLAPRSTPIFPEPSIKSYNTVLTCWARAHNNDTGPRAERVLARMDEWRRDCHEARQTDPTFPYRGCYPTAFTVSSMINAWTASSGFRVHKRALQLLQEVVEAQRNPSMLEHRFCKVRLDPALFNSVITSWVRSGRRREAATKAEEILAFAVKLHDEGLMKEPPSHRTYALVLHAWAKCEDSNGHCAQRAHDILVNMIRLYRQGVPIQFNAVAFSTCVSAWSRCVNVSYAPEKAEAILQELLSLHEETGLVDFQPDVGLWNAMLTVWVYATERRESMHRCTETIQRMQEYGCEPTILSYFKVLQAAGRRGLGDQALALLQQYAVHSNLPLLSDVRCLNVVLEALAREARDDSMDRATAFLEKMKCQDTYAKPNATSYTILLDALSRSEASRQAELGRDLLEGMMQRFQQGDTSCRPDPHVVSVVLKLCAGTNGTDDDKRRALDIALEIFRKCESHFGVSPNHFVYNALLHTINRLAVSQDQRLELLENVFEIYTKPSASSYTIYLNALSRSEGFRHADRGRDLLEKMMQRFQQGDGSCRPDAHVMLAVLKLCAYTNGTDDDRRRALAIALEIFRKCESHFGVSPNHFVYGAMLYAINRLASSKDRRSERLELLEKVFDECRAKGYVSVAVLAVMHQGGASHMFKMLSASSSRKVPHKDRPGTGRLASEE